MRQIILALILSITPLSAATFYTIDTARPLNCRFSIQQHNRILIENGRIKKVIFPEDKLYVRMEEISGQVFIQAKNYFHDKTVVSIVSQAGVVQDIEIEFVDQPSQVVVLQEKIQNQLLQETCYAPCPAINNLTGMVETILQGQIPSGFFSVPITNSCKTVKSGIKAKLVGRLKGCHEDLYIYQIHNARMWAKRLLERDLTCSGASWVYLQKSCLEANETVLAIVAIKR